jgi:hypothetical protein
MKIKNIALLILCFCLILSLTACKESKVQNIEVALYTNEIAVEKESILQSDADYDEQLLENPDRGFRMEVRMDADKKSSANVAIGTLDYWRRFYKSDKPCLVQTYFYLTGLPDTLPQESFDAMQKYFDACRKRGIKILLRFAYQRNMGVQSPGDLGEATMSTMLSHIGQLNPILEKNKDVIYAMQVGFIGAWGEWHAYSDRDTHEIDETALVKAVVDIAPKELYLQMRYAPDHDLHCFLLGEDYSERLGFHNDNLLGIKIDSESFGTMYWDYKTERAHLTPQDAEMMWGSETYKKLSEGLLPSAYAENDPKTMELKWSNVVGELVEHCYTSLSIHHSYKETEVNNGTKPPYTMAFWQDRKLSPEQLDELGFFYSPDWFKNENGKNESRSQFEYVRDYLGYRLALNNYSAKGSLSVGSPLEVAVNLTNYGFSAAFNIESGFAILDENDNVVSFTKAGDPKKWYSRKNGTKGEYTHQGFVKFEKSEPLTHDISANLTLPETAGKYKIAVGAFSTNGNPVYFANEMQIANGYHILAEIDVK